MNKIPPYEEISLLSVSVQKQLKEFRKELQKQKLCKPDGKLKPEGEVLFNKKHKELTDAWHKEFIEISKKSPPLKDQIQITLDKWKNLK